MADLIRLGSSGFGTFRIDPNTGQVFHDPSDPGGWPEGVTEDRVSFAVRDAAGAVTFGKASVDVSKAPDFPAFTSTHYAGVAYGNLTYIDVLGSTTITVTAAGNFSGVLVGQGGGTELQYEGGGGGGAGDVVTFSDMWLEAGDYAVVIGNLNNSNGNDGEASSFAGLIAIGGAKGGLGGSVAKGYDGASGSGAGTDGGGPSYNPPGNATGITGHAGGRGYNGSNSNHCGGGGGGGAGGAGTGGEDYDGGAGGLGIVVAMPWGNYALAAGGGGAGRQSVGDFRASGIGGRATRNGETWGDGVPNTGSGAGGTAYNSSYGTPGKGGSGRLIIWAVTS